MTFHGLHSISPRQSYVPNLLNYKYIIFTCSIICYFLHVLLYVLFYISILYILFIIFPIVKACYIPLLKKFSIVGLTI